MKKSLINRTSDNPIREYITSRRESQKSIGRTVAKYIAGGVAATALVVGAFYADSVLRGPYINPDTSFGNIVEEAPINILHTTRDSVTGIYNGITD